MSRTGFHFASSGSRRRSTSGALSRSMRRSACGGFVRFGSPFSPRIPSNQARSDRLDRVSFVQKGVRESYQNEFADSTTRDLSYRKKRTFAASQRDANITRTNVFIRFEHFAAQFDSGRRRVK